MIDKHRSGESGSIPYRSGRLRCISDQWFFKRRGQSMVGPFRDQDEAEVALDRYMKSMR